MPRLTPASLRKVLTNELKLKSPEFHLATGRAGLINGHIVSLTFKGKRDRQRQGMIWDALEFAFGREAAQHVGMLLAYTPDEWHMDETLVPTAAKPKRKKAG
jgi:acid stress-induced BolA-like protein IbaG/YrbA